MIAFNYELVSFLVKLLIMFRTWSVVALNTTSLNFLLQYFGPARSYQYCISESTVHVVIEDCSYKMSKDAIS